MLCHTLSIFSRCLTLIGTAGLFVSTLAFGQAETIAHDFISMPHGNSPQAALVGDAAGNLYGTTKNGGTYGTGTVFKLSPDSNGKWTESVLYSFSVQDPNGYYPVAGLVIDGAGNLYGTTSYGGAVCAPNTCYGPGGTVFELSPNSNGTWTANPLHSFGATGDGIGPVASLIFDAAGNLYGTTEYGGGANDYGTVFELSPSASGWTETILYSFQGISDGGYPVAGLTFDKAGNLYSTSSVGGDVNCNNYGYAPYGCGVVFELVHNSSGAWTESALHNFEINDGAFPQANVVFDASGNLVGTTPNGPGPNCSLGCGTIFQMTPGAGGAWNFKTVYTFAGGLDGGTPASGLVLGADGSFYGTTKNGGDANNCQYGCGTAYSVTPSSGFTWKEKIIHRFSGSATNPYGLDGEFPVANVIFDQAGNLYGTASGGGPGAQCPSSGSCGGTVFKLSKSSSGQWNAALLSTFITSGDAIQADGELPGGLISDSVGNLYSSTRYGGQYGLGAVYQLLPLAGGGYKERVIYSFKGGTDGVVGAGGLVMDSAGNLYGATLYGGVNSQCTYLYGCGILFELSPAGGGKWTETILHSFSSADGFGVNAPLAIDASGNLFGTTYGYTGEGTSTAFELSPSGGSWTFSVLHTFTSPDLFTPVTPLTVDSSGNLYGSGQGGNRGAGVVYELSPGASGYTVSTLHTFAGGADGAFPLGQLLNKSGVLIGATYSGGISTCPYQCGTVFAIAKSGTTWQKKTIYSFHGGTDAAQPWSSPIEDAAGNLYGSTISGGSGPCTAGCGAVYKLTASGGTWSESVVSSFGIVPNDIYESSYLFWSPSNILYGTGPGGDDGGGAVIVVDLNQAPQSLPQSQQPVRPATARPYRAPAPIALSAVTPSAKTGKGGN